MSLRKLPGVAEVAMQSGLYTGHRIERLQKGHDSQKPFKYHDLGSAAYLYRGNAVVSAGRMKLSGFPGWVVWLFIHIAFLTGYRNRAGAILTWWLAFTRDSRRERAFTTRAAGCRTCTSPWVTRQSSIPAQATRPQARPGRPHSGPHQPSPPPPRQMTKVPANQAGQVNANEVNGQVDATVAEQT